MTMWIHVVINPASGQPQPVLHTLNKVFREAGVRWTLSITQESGDATRFARQAAGEGVDVVAAYGGDGTVMEVAHALMDGPVPMAILPGGTANLMSVELGIPRSLEQAARVACSPDRIVRKVDMGQAGDRRFMLRLGMGFEGEKVRLADRELKDRYGIMAYTIAGLKALKSTHTAHYDLVIDGQAFEFDGLSCLVDNAGNLGLQGLSLAKEIAVDDGLLDVIIVRDASVSSLVTMASKVTQHGPEPNPDQIFHRQGREIRITTTPPLVMQGDGEIWGDTPVEVKVLPGVLPVVTLAEAGK